MMQGTKYFRAAALAAIAAVALVASSATQPLAEAADDAAYTPASAPATPEVMRLRDGLAAAEIGDWGALAGLRDSADDPLVKKLLEWRYATATGADAPLDFAPLRTALTDLQDWPGRTTMRTRAEQAIFTSNLSPQERIDFLRQDHGPITGDGRIALAQALRQAGQLSEGNEIARAAWRNDSLTDTAQATAQSYFSGVLTQSDYADRVAMLLWREQRSTARDLLSHLGPADRALANARLALQTKQRRGLQRVVAAVPGSREDDPGLLYDRTQYVRRTGRPEDAMAIAARINANDAPLMARADIFQEKRLYVPRALRSGQFQLAYNLVRNNGMSSGESFADGEFLQGWIQLRFLHENAGAATHFSHLAANVSSPVSKARALFWQAEAAKANGDTAGADAMLTQAAQYPFTYYGQLAATRRGTIPAMLSLPEMPAAIGADARQRFESRELVRALKLMSQVGAQKDFESFAFYLDDTLSDPQEIELLSQMAREQAYNRTALRSAKAGLFRGVVAVNAAYPLLDLPPATRASSAEPALVLAIIRQESEFDVAAVSSANARGLMQLIPSTARITANAQGMPYQTESLTSDPNYNVTLGAAHLGSLIDEFNGSYVLAVAGYNAGSFRARDWINDWGDPRSASTDVVDWVELIPFAETRNYVQRVMENLQVYRYRLAGHPVPITLEQDLRRGTPG